jgi:hypothetical protein
VVTYDNGNVTITKIELLPDITIRPGKFQLAYKCIVDKKEELQ